MDLPPKHRHERDEEWFRVHDRNERADGSVLAFVSRTKSRMEELLAQLRRIDPKYRAPARAKMPLPA
jgi:hypothetical protein